MEPKERLDNTAFLEPEGRSETVALTMLFSQDVRPTTSFGSISPPTFARIVLDVALV